MRDPVSSIENPVDQSNYCWAYLASLGMTCTLNSLSLFLSFQWNAVCWPLLTNSGFPFALS